MPKQDKVIVEVFTDEEIAALFEAAHANPMLQYRLRDSAILALLLDTGIRASELCGLTIGNTHLDSGDPYIKVLGKGQKEREIGPLGNFARRELKHYMGTYRKGAELTDLVFLNRFREPFTVWGLDDMIRTLGKRANIEGVRCSPHTLRHTWACNFLLAGGDLFKLSLLNGTCGPGNNPNLSEDYSIKASQERKVSPR